MKYSRLWVLTAIIAFIILVGFAFSVPHTRDGTKPAEKSVATSTPAVTLRDSFKKGVHTITGSLLAPNACSLVTAQAILSGETANTILVELSLPEDSGLCLQVPTKESFTTTITAPAGLPVVVTVNGVVATTTSS